MFSAAAAGYAAVDVFLTVLAWPDECSVSLRLLRREPSAMYDKDGVELDLVRLGVTNATGALVIFNSAFLEAEVKLGDQWHAAPSPAPFSSIRGWSETQEVVLVPRGADAYRIRFRYHYLLPLAEQRFLDWALANVPRLQDSHLIGHLLSDHWYRTRFGALYREYSRHRAQWRCWRHGETSELILQRASGRND